MSDFEDAYNYLSSSLKEKGIELDLNKNELTKQELELFDLENGTGGVFKKFFSFNSDTSHERYLLYIYN